MYSSLMYVMDDIAEIILVVDVLYILLL